ncbi:hypothetical protein JKP88DRAFT_272184 [Tribonema minus]|uniref:Uncharacterized protein n=1 Tax=Tribonema minus TaxID=303371 RepID=A0A835ZIQ5_9STRA|nr:hypothetical protein JKP88DRAFT_272184 [Tribonema minus]
MPGRVGRGRAPPLGRLLRSAAGASDGGGAAAAAAADDGPDVPGAVEAAVRVLEGSGSSHAALALADSVRAVARICDAGAAGGDDARAAERGVLRYCAAARRAAALDHLAPSRRMLDCLACSLSSWRPGDAPGRVFAGALFRQCFSPSGSDAPRYSARSFCSSDALRTMRERAEAAPGGGNARVLGFLTGQRSERELRAEAAALALDAAAATGTRPFESAFDPENLDVWSTVASRVYGGSGGPGAGAAADGETALWSAFGCEMTGDPDRARALAALALFSAYLIEVVSEGGGGGDPEEEEEDRDDGEDGDEDVDEDEGEGDEEGVDEGDGEGGEGGAGDGAAPATAAAPPTPAPAPSAAAAAAPAPAADQEAAAAAARIESWATAKPDKIEAPGAGLAGKGNAGCGEEATAGTGPAAAAAPEPGGPRRTSAVAAAPAGKASTASPAATAVTPAYRKDTLGSFMGSSVLSSRKGGSTATPTRKQAADVTAARPSLVSKSAESAADEGAAAALAMTDSIVSMPSDLRSGAL